MKTKQFQIFGLLILLCFSCQKKEEAAPRSELLQVMEQAMHSMSAQSSSKNPDYDFTALMIEHHRAAVAMANIELAKGISPELRQMARQIVNTQQQEIAEMQQKLATYQQASPNEEFRTKLQQINKSMDTRVKLTRLTGKPDADFALLMILHHQSALEMAAALQQYGQDQSLKDKARQMASNQLQEMQQLQAWLNLNL